jgi:5-methylcytosine-specific restriction endonuclease McrA
MTNSLVKHRHAAYLRQGERCWYCNCPMWETDAAAFAARLRITSKLARLLQCTSEHLIPKSDGGKAVATNIVAACRYCNNGRHKARMPSPADAMLIRVRRLVAQGRWLPHGLHKLTR